MATPVITVHKLGKQYRIGAKIDPEGRDNFRDVILNSLKAPFKNFRRLQKLTNFDDTKLSALRPTPPSTPYALCSTPSTPDTIWALKDVSFDVHKGEVVGIIGKNGSGKSTLLKILSRITEPTEGYVEFRGRISSLLEVGTGFHRELTGRENVYLNGTILGMKKWEIDEKFDEIVAFSEIEKFLDTPVKHYSSGMYVRLAFAVAAHLNPDILLVDEVLAVGDAAFQKKCVGKMQDVAGEGRTVLVVSHNMSTVKYLCSRAMLLEQGSLKISGSVDSVVGGYLNVNKSDQSEKIVSDKDHLTGINKMRINRIRLQNASSNSFSVSWRQPICVLIEVDVFVKIEEVSFGAGIRTQDGVAVLSVHHDDSGVPRWTFEPGRYNIEFALQNELRPGLYKLGVGAHEKYIAKNLCYLPDVVDLKVLDFASDGQLVIQHNAGLVNGSSSWQYPRMLTAGQ